MANPTVPNLTPIMGRIDVDLTIRPASILSLEAKLVEWRQIDVETGRIRHHCTRHI